MSSLHPTKMNIASDYTDPPANVAIEHHDTSIDGLNSLTEDAVLVTQQTEQGLHLTADDLWESGNIETPSKPSLMRPHDEEISTKSLTVVSMPIFGQTHDEQDPSIPSNSALANGNAIPQFEYISDELNNQLSEPHDAGYVANFTTSDTVLSSKTEEPAVSTEMAIPEMAVPSPSPSPRDVADDHNGSATLDYIGSTDLSPKNSHANQEFWSHSAETRANISGLFVSDIEMKESVDHTAETNSAEESEPESGGDVLEEDRENGSQDKPGEGSLELDIENEIEDKHSSAELSSSSVESSSEKEPDSGSEVESEDALGSSDVDNEPSHTKEPDVIVLDSSDESSEVDDRPQDEKADTFAPEPPSGNIRTKENYEEWYEKSHSPEPFEDGEMETNYGMGEHPPNDEQDPNDDNISREDSENFDNIVDRETNTLFPISGVPNQQTHELSASTGSDVSTEHSAGVLSEYDALSRQNIKPLSAHSNLGKLFPQSASDPRQHPTVPNTFQSTDNSEPLTPSSNFYQNETVMPAAQNLQEFQTTQDPATPQLPETGLVASVEEPSTTITDPFIEDGIDFAKMPPSVSDRILNTVAQDAESSLDDVGQSETFQKTEVQNHSIVPYQQDSETLGSIKTNGSSLEPETVSLGPDPNAAGFRTSLSYFSPLSTIANYFNTAIDSISIVLFSSKIAQATKGPRDYYLTLYVTDPSMSGMSVCAQIFRKHKDSFPAATKGDAIILRDFIVRSANHSLMLQSMETSSWAVFPQDGGYTQIHGPPVEFGDEEQEFVSGLRKWYQEEGAELVAKPPKTMTYRTSNENNSSIASSDSGSVTYRNDPMNILNKYAKAKKPKHRRVTIHELRHGRRYTEVGSPSDRESIHELRDGTIYANDI